MNTLRAMLFAFSVTAVLTAGIDHVATAATTPVYRLDPVEVTARRANFDADGTLKTVRAAVTE